MGTLLGSNHVRAAALDIDRDAREEIIIFEGREFWAFAVVRVENGELHVLCKHQQGCDGGAPILIDFDRDGRIDIVFQGGRGWTVQVFRTTENGLELVAQGKGGLGSDIKRARLRWLVPCGTAHGRYSGSEGSGGIQSRVPYDYAWFYDSQAFSLMPNSSIGNELADALWTCHYEEPEDVAHDRYVDSWNYAVCLLASRLEYEKALELAGRIPESPQGEKGRTMSSDEKKALIQRVQELSRLYERGSRPPRPSRGARGDVLRPYFRK